MEYGKQGQGQFTPPLLHHAESALARFYAFKAAKGESLAGQRDQNRLKQGCAEV
jgi:hypothetical protein